MLKSLFRGITAIILSFCVTLIPVFAVEQSANSSSTPFSSEYLARCSISLSSGGSGKVSVSFTVSAKSSMDKLGAQSIVIEQNTGNGWRTYKTYTGTSTNGFYDYDAILYGHSFSFSATSGVSYRAVLTAYAQNSSGSETDTAISDPFTCL
ncbi:MAG: hypothetical protein ACLR28_13935 [Flavonifractor plautii]|jgi:hypothetical protein|uniref:hypothetical protein n=1 Tax=Flavonifractor plautii TaxID=292800 RepID=UPI0018A8A867|nr:hypothetical protein [Flavonifractor plautii]